MQRQKTVFQIFIDPHMLVVGSFGSRQISLLLSSSIHPQCPNLLHLRSQELGSVWRPLMTLYKLKIIIPISGIPPKNM